VYMLHNDLIIVLRVMENFLFCSSVLFSNSICHDVEMKKFLCFHSGAYNIDDGNKRRLDLCYCD
jgi:hypothetical protein